MDELNCAVCVRPVDIHASVGEDSSGGYIPLTFPNEAPVKIWVHHSCLATPGLRSRQSQVCSHASASSGALTPVLRHP